MCLLKAQNVTSLRPCSKHSFIAGCTYAEAKVKKRWYMHRMQHSPNQPTDDFFFVRNQYIIN